MNRPSAQALFAVLLISAPVAQAGPGEKRNDSQNWQQKVFRDSGRPQSHNHSKSQRHGHGGQHQDNDRKDEEKDVVTIMPITPSGSPTPIAPYKPVRVVRDHRGENRPPVVYPDDPTGGKDKSGPQHGYPIPRFAPNYQPQPGDVTSVDGTGIGGVVEEIIDILDGGNFEGQAKRTPIPGPVIRDHRPKVPRP